MRAKTNLKYKKGAYWPRKNLKKQAWLNKAGIYKKALKNPLKFWEQQAEELKWRKKWSKVFSRKGDGFEWFSNGKLNITETCLDEQIKIRKNKIAIIWQPEPLADCPRVITYNHLFKLVNKFSNVLKKIGVKKGDKVGIYLPMVPETIIAMLACARIGAIHTVVFSAFSPQALKIRLQDTGSKVLITSDGYYRRGKVINLKQNADKALVGTKVKKVIVVERTGNKINMKQGRDYWWEQLMEKADEWCAPTIMDSEDPLFILYTSGSTGRPKGTVQTCGGYATQAKATAKYIFNLKEDDIFWSTADLGWITGHTYSCYAPLLNGAIFMIYEGAPDWPTPDRWARLIEKYGVTIFYTAPTAVRMFEKYGTDVLKNYKFETLRLLGSVGEPIDQAAWQWYFEQVGKKKCPIVDTWWQTETGGILISSLPGIGPFKPSFAGRPFPGIKFDIIDDDGKKMKPNKEGNLVIREPFSPGLLRAVYKNPEKYQDTYWKKYGRKTYFTSDSAFYDKNGLIRIVGRIDDVLKIAGHRFTTGEIESAIALHPAITEAAVVSREDKIKGEVPVAFVVRKTSSKSPSALKKEVINQVRKTIGPIVSLKQIYIVEDLPKTRSGKIMRRVLRKLFTKEPLGDLSTLANAPVVEQIKKIIIDNK